MFYHLIQFLSLSIKQNYDCNTKYEKTVYGSMELIGDICV